MRFRLLTALCLLLAFAVYSSAAEASTESQLLM